MEEFLKETSTYQTYIIGIIILIIFNILKRPRISANEPPLVPYTIPILGHTYDYLFNSKEFINKCKEQYGDCYSIYVFGHVMTILSRNPLTEVFRNSDDFDLLSASSETLPLHHLFIYNGGINRVTAKFHSKTTREQISGKIDVNIGIVQKYLLKGLEKWIGDCNDPKIIHNAWNMVNGVIAIPIANILVGEEAASHEDLVNSLENLAFDLGPLIIIPPIFAFIHMKLHEFVMALPFKFGWNPVSRHRKIVVNRLRPVIEKRLKERKELGDKYKPYNDLLEYYMNQPDFDYTKPNNLYYYVDNIFFMTFVSIHTTSRTAADALYDLAGRPESLDELYEEALTIDKECNGTLTLDDVNKMVKLDSFLKESLRHSDCVLNFAHHMISKSFTFSNGFTIPEGRKIIMQTDDMLKAKEHFGEDAEEFKPFRFVNLNSPATKVDRSYIVFGGGKHACPGRFFAINEAKVFLHKLILKYRVSTENKKLAKKVFIGPLSVPSRDNLVFEKSKK